MIVEIDQSGKLEQLNTATAVAYSDEKQGAVWISAAVKRSLVIKLRKILNDGKALWPILFAIVIFISIEELASDVILKIDEEYTGKDSIISKQLKELLNRRFVGGWRGSIQFGRIGKKSFAHRLAWRIHRTKNKVGVKSLREEDILRLIT